MSPEDHKVRVLIMAGGTGGHVFPGIAVAEQLRAQGHEVIWLGTERGLESHVVPQADLPLEQITISGLRGKGIVALLLAPLHLLRAIWQSLMILRRLQPDVVLGMGGFVSGPGGAAAWLLRLPVCVHEQNSVAGMTNQLLSRVARRVMEAFPGAMPADAHAEHVGNPVRQALHGLPEPHQRLAGRSGPVRLLVLGGSQGARRLNQVVPAAVGQLIHRLPFDVRHQTGSTDQDLVRRNYKTLGVKAEVSAFIDDMTTAYSWADMIICRAGALTVAELTAVGLASVLVPYPHAVDDHQTSNARWLCEHDAAVLIPDAELTAARLAEELLQLGGDRERLQVMAVNARSLATPDAAAKVASICLEEAA